ncbi:hypothetical protein THAOC_01037, partial [Thalassiosira oceanica]
QDPSTSCPVIPPFCKDVNPPLVSPAAVACSLFRLNPRGGSSAWDACRLTGRVAFLRPRRKNYDGLTLVSEAVPKCSTTCDAGTIFFKQPHYSNPEPATESLNRQQTFDREQSPRGQVDSHSPERHYQVSGSRRQITGAIKRTTPTGDIGRKLPSNSRNITTACQLGSRGSGPAEGTPPTNRRRPPPSPAATARSTSRSQSSPPPTRPRRGPSSAGRVPPSKAGAARRRRSSRHLPTRPATSRLHFTPNGPFGADEWFDMRSEDDGLARGQEWSELKIGGQIGSGQTGRGFISQVRGSGSTYLSALLSPSLPEWIDVT